MSTIFQVVIKLGGTYDKKTLQSKGDIQRMIGCQNKYKVSIKFHFECERTTLKATKVEFWCTLDKFDIEGYLQLLPGCPRDMRCYRYWPEALILMECYDYWSYPFEGLYCTPRKEGCFYIVLWRNKYTMYLYCPMAFVTKLANVYYIPREDCHGNCFLGIIYIFFFLFVSEKASRA